MTQAHYEQTAAALRAIKNTADSISLRRKFWKEETKPDITRVFSEMKAAFQNFPLVQIKNYDSDDLETLRFGFLNESSGIVVGNSKEMFAIEKIGGQLIYLPDRIGKINVRIQLPLLNRTNNERTFKELGQFEPNVLRDGTIWEQLINFLKICAEWDCGNL